MTQREPAKGDDTTPEDAQDSTHEAQPTEEPDAAQRKEPARAESAEPDRKFYDEDGKCRPHGNPWRCPRCLAMVSDITVFNNL